MALIKQDGSQGCLKSNFIPPPYDLYLWEVDAVKRGAKEIKSQTRTILETINTLYNIEYNLHFKHKNMNKYVKF